MIVMDTQRTQSTKLYICPCGELIKVAPAPVDSLICPKCLLFARLHVFVADPTDDD